MPRNLFTGTLVISQVLLLGYSWHIQPTTVQNSQRSEQFDSRRQVLRSLVLQSAAPLLLLNGNEAFAKNLPDSTGADTSKVGTVEALIPIVSLRYSLSLLEPKLKNRERIKLDQSTFPTKEQDFKRLFDAYSDPVSYKQKFLDQNAFLVYYTKGFDGPGRENIENDVNERQTMQFGARNEAWIAFDNFLVELKFIDDDDNDLTKYLADTIRAVDSYLRLAPLSDVKEAQSSLGASW